MFLDNFTKLEAIVDVIYKNEVNSYTIANLETETEVFTVVGYLPFINAGDTLKLQGKMVIHQEYGEQFKIDTFEKMMPETLDALEKYLASGTIKGISSGKVVISVETEETPTITKNINVRVIFGSFVTSPSPLSGLFFAWKNK